MLNTPLKCTADDFQVYGNEFYGSFDGISIISNLRGRRWLRSVHCYSHKASLTVCGFNVKSSNHCPSHDVKHHDPVIQSIINLTSS